MVADSFHPRHPPVAAAGLIGSDRDDYDARIKEGGTMRKKRRVRAGAGITACVVFGSSAAATPTAAPTAAFAATAPSASSTIMASSSGSVPANLAAPVATTRFGDVRGVVEDGINVFKGIPYGAPTSGVNRFMPPRDPKPWQGIRKALDYGPRCPQLLPPGAPGRAAGAAPFLKGTSEDCLVLNVWTPGLRDGRKRPVMVWMHGGGYTLLSGSSPAYDGVRLAKKGDIVLVTLNHRLNLFGYMYLAGLPGGEKFADSGNIGQLDLIAALRWVRDNIETFGGDPNTVMIFGESGGGGKVSTLLAMPAAHGLFQRAAMQSGFGVTALTSEAATQMTRSILDALGLEANQLDKLQRMPVEPMLAALEKVTGGMPFGIGPVVDGRSLARHPFTPAAPDTARDVPVLLGYNKTETTVLFPPPGSFDLDWPGLTKQLTTPLPGQDVAKVIGPNVAKIVDGWRARHPQATPSDLYFAITTEAGMGLNATTVAQRKAEQGGAPAYLYRLEWETPIEGGRMRSPHGLDVPLVFDNVAKAPGQIGTGTQEAQQVADTMSAAWLAFARYGTPNAAGLPSWPAFSARYRETMIFNVTSRAVNDPLHDERLLLPHAP
jgi:para-nitrobenzyl esterase